MKVHQREQILISFSEGPKVEILGSRYKKYKIEFINSETEEILHSNTIHNNMWTKCSIQWNVPWVIKINKKVHHTLNLKGKEVKVTFQSKSIGDTLAWMPQVKRFAEIYECKVTTSTFHNSWFENHPEYKNINFIPPDTPGKFYATYQLGWFKPEGKWDEGSLHPTKPNTVPLAQTASDILNIPYEEVSYGINFKPKERPLPTPYICIGPRSTAGLKEWNIDYWGKLAKDLNSLGYKVVSISHEGFNVPGVIDRGGMEWEDSINYLYHANLFIGLGSGLSWMNWTLGKYTVMINNFNPYGLDFTQNMKQIQNHSVCNGCWANPNFQFDPGNWHWCPKHQNTELQHICQKSITPEQVLKEVKYVLKYRLNEKDMGQRVF